MFIIRHLLKLRTKPITWNIAHLTIMKIVVAVVDSWKTEITVVIQSAGHQKKEDNDSLTTEGHRQLTKKAP